MERTDLDNTIPLVIEIMADRKSVFDVMLLIRWLAGLPVEITIEKHNVI